MPAAVGRTTTVPGSISGSGTSSTDIFSGPCHTIPFIPPPLRSECPGPIVRPPLSAWHEREGPHRRARTSPYLQWQRQKEAERRQPVQVVQVLDYVHLVAKQRVVGRVLRRDGGVYRERVAPDQRDVLPDQVFGGIPGEARPVFEEMASFRARSPPVVPSVADQNP